jgi:hypothetical protein
VHWGLNFQFTNFGEQVQNIAACLYLLFMGDESEAKKHGTTCSWSHGQQMDGAGFELKMEDHQRHLASYFLCGASRNFPCTMSAARAPQPSLTPLEF